MTYKTEYNLDEWHGDLWLGEIPIIVYADSYSVSNETYDDEFGVVRCPDFIEDITWKVDQEATDPAWLCRYTVDQLEKMINEDFLFFEVKSAELEKSLTEEEEDARMDQLISNRGMW